jgi:Fe-S cluster assembly protein SufD
MIRETPMSAAARYLEEFARVESGLPGTALPWMRSIRKAALERFVELGFPSTRDEDWKYTSVAGLERRAFRLLPARAPDLARLSELVPGDRSIAVFVNGRFVPALSRLHELPGEIRVAGLAQALAEDRGLFEEVLARRVRAAANGFAALNAALMTGGAHVCAAPGSAAEQPIELLFLTTEADLQNHTFNVIQAGAGARLVVVERWASLNGSAYFNNSVTELVMEPGASVEHYKLQEESLKAFHIAALHADQRQGSRFASHSFALGGQLSRFDVNASLNAESCETTLNGLYLSAGRQHVDHHTRVDHVGPRGVSREFYKGIMDGASRAVFNGRVIVHPGAQLTDAHQSNKNLLLSEHAEVDTKPQLEIYADDVKCTHGATVGQLDEAQVFYLRSRGMDEAAARSLLTYAFAADVIGRVGVQPLRARLERVLLERLSDPNRIREL